MKALLYILTVLNSIVIAVLLWHSIAPSSLCWLAGQQIAACIAFLIVLLVFFFSLITMLPNDDL